MSIRTSLDTQPAWNDLPPDVQGALKALHWEFEQAHITFGHATRHLCYWWIHPGHDVDEQNYSGQFNGWCDRYPAVQRHFSDLVTRNTPSFQFRAFFDFYIDMVAIDGRRIFAELVEISPKHGADGIAWAKAEAVRLVERNRHLVADWVRVATDKQADPKLWQAPLFLTMKPAGGEPYDPDRVWECMDAARNLELRNAFVDEYVQRFESYIERWGGDAYLEAAKRPKAAGKIINVKMVKASEAVAPESQADLAAKGRLTKEALGPWARKEVMKLSRDRNVSIDKLAAPALECDPKTVRRYIEPAGKLLIRGGPAGTVRAGSLQDLIRGRFPLEKFPADS